MYLQRSKLHKVKQKYAKMQACAKLKKELHNEAVFFWNCTIDLLHPTKDWAESIGEMYEWEINENHDHWYGSGQAY